jgi:hypothetical protein
VWWGATQMRGDQGGTVAGEACDAVDAGGLNGFSQRHVEENGDQATAPPLRLVSDTGAR